MAKDIVPELYDAIITNFENAVNDDKQIKAFSNSLEKHTATQKDASLYARRLGERASEALAKNLNSNTLPEGILYWNIGQRTIKPLMKKVHKMVNDFMMQVMTDDYEKKGIGLKPIRSKFNEDRIDAIINAAYHASKSMKENEDV